jgi:hypothetical protein
MTEAVEDSDPKDNRFNPSRIPATPKMQGLVDEIRRQLLSYEAKFHPRKKRRREVDQERFDRIVEAIVCDLVHGSLKDPRAWRHISLSKQRSGTAAVGAPFMTEARIGIIEWMARPEMDWLEFKKAAQIRNPFRGQQSTIRASRRLRRHVDELDLQFEDIGRDMALMSDPIVLKGPKVKGKAETLPVPVGEPADTYRAEMVKINTWLTSADISCDLDKHGNERDVGDRWLTRIFNNGRMDEGGRPTGGFWGPMSGQSRLTDICINGESVASLDYGQCAIRIAYGMAGEEPPVGDLYCVPGLEGFREGVKKVLISLFFSAKELGRKPKGSTKHLPKHLDIRDVEELILRHHKPLHPLFYAGIGMTIQCSEGNILVRTLLALIEHKVVALPVYDCLVVPRSAIEVTERVMLECFKSIAGVAGNVAVKEGGGA